MNVPCEINVEAACKNQHCHSEAGEGISYFSFQVKKSKEEILRAKGFRIAV
jgi:hypothetical protein